MRTLPPVLSIAGSDNSAGAGIQADLKTMSASGVYGLTAVTCVVAEVPGKVSAIFGLPPALVAEQIRLLFEAFPIAALKTGMLHSTAILKAVVTTFAEVAAERPLPPLVVDPVMIATSGDRLLEVAAVTMYCERLFPLASLITPNLDEAAVLLGEPIEGKSALRDAGHVLAKRFGTAFLMKGGHLKEAIAGDLLILPDGMEHRFEAPFVYGVSTHGTGCTYSAAVAAELGKGAGLVEAVGAAKALVNRAVNGYLRWEKSGQQTDALHHFSQCF